MATRLARRPESKSHFLSSYLVPMAVSNLRVTNDGTSTSLKVKWQRPSGHVDSYNITLSHQGTIKESRMLAPQVIETQFKDLIPGRLYQVTVSCVSGDLSAQKTAVGRTGESRARKTAVGRTGESSLLGRRSWVGQVSPGLRSTPWLPR